MSTLVAETCESCGERATVQLPDKSWWCLLCDAAARRLGYDDQPSFKVLSLWQPWASLVAMGVKTIETRSWRAPQALIGKRIAIHAAKTPSGGIRWLGPYQYYVGRGGAWMCEGSVGLNIGLVLPLGAIVATARLAGCVPMSVFPMPNGARRWLWVPPGRADLNYSTDDGAEHFERDCSGQLPYGDFRDGRWAWLLEDVQPLAEPVPFKGGQGLTKTWEVPDVHG